VGADADLGGSLVKTFLFSVTKVPEERDEERVRDGRCWKKDPMLDELVTLDAVVGGETGVTEVAVAVTEGSELCCEDDLDSSVVSVDSSASSSSSSSILSSNGLDRLIAPLCR
jgi:hypothetical protein